MKLILEPENKELEITKVKTVRGLLNKLGLNSTQALVIRDGQLLTPDEKLFPKDVVKVRKVASRG